MTQQETFAELKKYVLNANTEAVRTLLATDAGKEVASVDNNYVLYSAAANGHIGIVKMLLDISYVKDNVADNNNALLHWAAENGHVDIVKMLLEIPSVKDNAAVYNNYALRFAAKNGHTDIVKMLLKIPVIKDNASANNNYALYSAAENGHIDIVKKLLKIPCVKDNAADSNNLALCVATESGHTNIVKILLEIPSVKNNAAVNNNYALCVASENGYANIVKMLLEIPCVKYNVAADNNDALLSAAENNHIEIFKMLLKVDTLQYELLRNEAKNLISILKECSSQEHFSSLVNAIRIYGVPLSKVVNFKEDKLWEEHLRSYCLNPDSINLDLTESQLQAARLLKAYQDAINHEYERKYAALAAQEANPDDEKKLNTASSHFAKVIQPHFEAAFLERGDDLEERLQNIESDIRALLISRRIVQAKQSIEKGIHVTASEACIRFLENNAGALRGGQDEILMNEARQYFSSLAQSDEIAWRVYDRWAPCEGWPNLLTSPLGACAKDKIFSASLSQVTHLEASYKAREWVAYSFLLVMDESNSKDADNKASRIEGFIAQLSDIRRAHNEGSIGIDNPSCYPGIIGRALNMWAMHSLGLQKNTIALLPDILRSLISQNLGKYFENATADAREALYNALIYLRYENAEDIINDRDGEVDFNQNEDYPKLRQSFIDSLGSHKALLDSIQAELKAMSAAETEDDEELLVYLLKYLADIGGGWSAVAITSLYQRYQPKAMEIKERETPTIGSKLTNPFCIPNWLPEKVREQRKQQSDVWEFLVQFLTPAYLFEEPLKQLATAWTKSRNQNSPDLLLSNYFDATLNETSLSNEQKITLKNCIAQEYKNQLDSQNMLIFSAPDTKNRKRRRETNDSCRIAKMARR